MTTILTPASAAAILRVTPADPVLADLLPQVDRYIINATGYDWSGDSTIREEAKAAARILLVKWYEDPGQIVPGGALIPGLDSVLAQLEALALRYRVYTFFGSNGAGSVYLAEARIGDVVESLTGIYLSTGDKSGLFESTISTDYYIQQTDGADYHEHKFRVVLRSAADVDP